MTTNVQGRAEIDGNLGLNPNWSSLNIRNGKIVEAVSADNTLQAYIVESVLRTNGHILSGGNFANPLGVRTTIGAFTEEKTLTSGQTIVPLSTLNASNVVQVFVFGPHVDDGFLEKDVDWSVTSLIQITLARSYPEGTKIRIAENNVSTDGVTLPSLSSTFVQEDPPVGSLREGMTWYKPSTGQDFIYITDTQNDSAWVEKSGGAGGGGSVSIIRDSSQGFPDVNASEEGTTVIFRDTLKEYALINSVWVQINGGAGGGGGGVVVVRNTSEGFPPIATTSEGTSLIFRDTLREYRLVSGAWVEDGNVGDELDIAAASHLTVAQAKSRVFTVGHYVIITDRAFARAIVRPSGQVANETNLIALDDGKILEVLADGDAVAEHFGAQGGTDSTNAIKAAISAANGQVILLGTNYDITDQLVITGNCTGIQGRGSIDTKMIKKYNGNLIHSINQGSIFERFWIDDTSTGTGFDGGGFYMTADNCHIRNIRITNTRDAGVIYQANEAAFNTINTAHIQARSNGYGVRSDGDDDILTPTTRTFEKLSGGGRIVNFAGMNRAILRDSFGSVIGFSTASDKITVESNRFSSTFADITILGNGHNFTGNTIGFSASYNIILANGSEGVSFDDSNIVSVGGSLSGIVDQNTTGAVTSLNALSTTSTDFNATWGGLTTNGSYGSTPASTTYKREGRQLTLSFNLVRAADATLPTGNWFIELPFNAKVTTTGSLAIKSSSGTWNAGVLIVQGGSNRAFLYIHGQSSPVSESTLSFSTGGQINASITYITG